MTNDLEPARYTTAGAFHTALEARLRELAGRDPHRLASMRAQVAISRLLVRLSLTQPGEWITKGGTCLLARLGELCRLSRDLNLARREMTRSAADAIRQAADLDADDWLTYRCEGSRALRQADMEGVRLRIKASIGSKEYVRFGIDIVDELDLSGRLERREPYSPLTLVGAPSAQILLYPVEDHIADKLSAMGKLREHAGGLITSTRYRDLADLALIAAGIPAESLALLGALDAPARHWARDAFGATGLRAPGPEWPQRYGLEARTEPYVRERWPTLDRALAAARPLVDPALNGSARGTWDPVTATWR